MDTGMIHRLRVLLLEPNRFLSLLMEREIKARYRSAVTARFDDENAAAEELNRTRYDVAVVDVERSGESYGDLLADIRESRPRIVLIAIAPEGLIEAEGSDGFVWTDEVLPKDEQTYLVLPDMIDRYADRWQQVVGREGSESILDAESRSAVINLTVRTLAHEINNPLMTIMGTTELLLDTKRGVPAEQLDKIRMIQDSARRIQETLTDLAGENYPPTKRTPVGLMFDSRRQLEGVR